MQTYLQTTYVQSGLTPPFSPAPTVRFWRDPSTSLPPQTYARTAWMALNSLDIRNLV